VTLATDMKCQRNQSCPFPLSQACVVPEHDYPNNAEFRWLSDRRFFHPKLTASASVQKDALAAGAAVVLVVLAWAALPTPIRSNPRGRQFGTRFIYRKSRAPRNQGRCSRRLDKVLFVGSERGVQRLERCLGATGGPTGRVARLQTWTALYAPLATQRSGSIAATPGKTADSAFNDGCVHLGEVIFAGRNRLYRLDADKLPGRPLPINRSLVSPPTPKRFTCVMRSPSAS
jgi:hypothetical protein